MRLVWWAKARHSCSGQVAAQLDRETASVGYQRTSAAYQVDWSAKRAEEQRTSRSTVSMVPAYRL
ncbi:hypothetical protein [Streptomyces sp. NPDC088400]|uniref:hypothetical protein n=1 Tax=Streptomyces sp. NPDC088400 TaxID=3365861 RepID=UPI003804BF82